MAGYKALTRSHAFPVRMTTPWWDDGDLPKVVGCGTNRSILNHSITRQISPAMHSGRLKGGRSCPTVCELSVAIPK